MMAYMLRGPVHRMGAPSPPDPEALLPFDPRFMGLELFGSPQAKNHQLPRYLTKLTSYGLAYVHRLVSADADTRCAMLLDYAGSGSGTLLDLVGSKGHGLCFGSRIDPVDYLQSGYRYLVE